MTAKMKGQQNSGFNAKSLLNLFVKVYIRDKVLKKKDIYEFLAEIEEDLADQELEF
jgi:hypothetical protein